MSSTKITTRAPASPSTVGSRIEEAFVDLFSPIVSTLNNGFSPRTGDEEVRRGEEDKGLHYRFDNFIRQVLRQARGLPDDVQSQQYSSLNYFNDSEARLMKLYDIYKSDPEGFSADPRVEQAVYYSELNKMRLDADMELLNALQGAYQRLFNKKWVYTPLKAQNREIKASVVAKKNDIFASLAARAGEQTLIPAKK